MATQVQLRRGTQAENDIFTGAEGELTYCTDTKQLRIHDGQTVGGFPCDVVVEWQKPTEENSYTWYRKYASGWVEQGGIVNKTATNYAVAISFPIPMENKFYTAITSGAYYNIGTNDSASATRRVAAQLAGTPTAKTETGMTFSVSESSGSNMIAGWYVCGYAA